MKKRNIIRRHADMSDATMHLILQLVTILASMAGFMNSDFGKTVAKGVGSVARKLGESPELIRAIPGLISSLKTYGAKKEEVDKALKKAEQVKASMERDKRLREAKEAANRQLRTAQAQMASQKHAEALAAKAAMMRPSMAKWKAMRAGMKSIDSACEEIMRIMRITDGVTDMIKSIRRYARVIR